MILKIIFGNLQDFMFNTLVVTLGLKSHKEQQKKLLLYSRFYHFPGLALYKLSGRQTPIFLSLIISFIWKVHITLSNDPRQPPERRGKRGSGKVKVLLQLITTLNELSRRSHLVMSNSRKKVNCPEHSFNMLYYFLDKDYIMFKIVILIRCFMHIRKKKLTKRCMEPNSKYICSKNNNFLLCLVFFTLQILPTIT